MHFLLLINYVIFCFGYRSLCNLKHSSLHIDSVVKIKFGHKKSNGASAGLHCGLFLPEKLFKQTGKDLLQLAITVFIQPLHYKHHILGWVLLHDRPGSRSIL